MIFHISSNYIRLFVLAICFLASQLSAQTLDSIPSPVGYDGFGHGYYGNPNLLNGKLCMLYRDNDLNYDLMVFDGQNMDSIPSPVGWDSTTAGFAWQGLNTLESIVYNNSLYMCYRGNDGSFDLFKYDGSNLVNIPTPATYDGILNHGCIGPKIIYNGLLYFKYVGQGISDMFSYDGNTLTKITPPLDDFGQPMNYYRSPIIFNGDLYSLFRQINYDVKLVKYDGNNFTKINSPVDYDPYVYLGNDPIVYDSVLYFGYKNTTSGNIAMVGYDGTNFKIIPSPPGYDTTNVGYVGTPFEFNGDLYVRYKRNDGKSRTLRFDGDTLTEIPALMNHDTAAQDLVFLSPFIYHNKLYCYLLSSGPYPVNYGFFEFDGANITGIPPPPGYNTGNSHYDGYSIIYKGIMYMQYRRDAVVGYDLVSFDGNQLTKIDAPPNYQSYQSYLGWPIEYNGDLYFEYYGNDSNRDLMRLVCPTTITTVTDTICRGDSLAGYSQTGTYVDTFASGSGCDSIRTLNLVVDTLNLDLGPNVPTCPGDTVTLSAGVAAGYQWSTGDTTPEITVTTPASYYVTVTNTNNCTASDVVYVVRITVPTPFFYPIVYDSTVEIGTSVINVDSIVYNYGDGTITTGDTHTYSSLGQYQVCMTVYNFCGSDSVCHWIDLTTGIAQPEMPVIDLYPNPFDQEVQVSVKGFVDGTVQLTVYDITGRVVLETALHTGDQLVSLHQLSAGSYMYHISTPTETLSRGRLVKAAR